MGGTVGPILYDACLNTVTSDHKPVKALYLYLARRRAGEPGPRDDLTLLHSWPRGHEGHAGPPPAAADGQSPPPVVCGARPGSLASAYLRDTLLVVYGDNGGATAST